MTCMASDRLHFRFLLQVQLDGWIVHDFVGEYDTKSSCRAAW